MPSGKFSIMYSFGVGIYFLGPPCTHTHTSLVSLALIVVGRDVNF